MKMTSQRAGGALWRGIADGGVAYYALAQCLAAVNGKDSRLRPRSAGIGKALISIGIYAVGIALSFVKPSIALALYVMVACIWVIPDRRIEISLKS
jgi:uncharacterized membrane protein